MMCISPATSNPPASTAMLRACYSKKTNPDLAPRPATYGQPSLLLGGVAFLPSSRVTSLQHGLQQQCSSQSYGTRFRNDGKRDCEQYCAASKKAAAAAAALLHHGIMWREHWAHESEPDRTSIEVVSASAVSLTSAAVRIRAKQYYLHSSYSRYACAACIHVFNQLNRHTACCVVREGRARRRAMTLEIS